MSERSKLLLNPDRLPVISASILGADFACLATDIDDIVTHGVQVLHVDIMDGHFVPNLTMGPAIVKSLRSKYPNVYLDVHLMVTEPWAFVEPFAKAGADLLSFHIEVTADHAQYPPQKMIELIRSHGCEAGIVINPDTPAQAIAPWLDAVDLALVMSVHPGYAGQKFIPDVLEKTRWLADRKSTAARIQMDGGINAQTAASVRDAGCDCIVAASALFGAEDRAEILRALRGW